MIRMDGVRCWDREFTTTRYHSRRMAMMDAARIVGLALMIVGAFCLQRHIFSPGDKMIDVIFIVVGTGFSLVPLLF